MEREKAYGNHDEPVLFLDQFLYEGKKILYAALLAYMVCVGSLFCFLFMNLGEPPEVFCWTSTHIWFVLAAYFVSYL